MENNYKHIYSLCFTFTIKKLPIAKLGTELSAQFTQHI